MELVLWATLRVAAGMPGTCWKIKIPSTDEHQSDVASDLHHLTRNMGRDLAAECKVCQSTSLSILMCWIVLYFFAISQILEIHHLLDMDDQRTACPAVQGTAGKRFSFYSALAHVLHKGQEERVLGR